MTRTHAVSYGVELAEQRAREAAGLQPIVAEPRVTMCDRCHVNAAAMFVSCDQQQSRTYRCEECGSDRIDAMMRQDFRFTVEPIGRRAS